LGLNDAAEEAVYTATLSDALGDVKKCPDCAGTMLS
jgi:hypothetical protein